MPLLWEKKDNSVNLDIEPVVSDQFDGMAKARVMALKSVMEKPLIFTSGDDGKHMPASLHYRGLAVDIRTRDYVDTLASLLGAQLGPDWDVVIEADHVHLEYDPE